MGDRKVRPDMVLDSGPIFIRYHIESSSALLLGAAHDHEGIPLAGLPIILRHGASPAALCPLSGRRGTLYEYGRHVNDPCFSLAPNYLGHNHTALFP